MKTPTLRLAIGFLAACLLAVPAARACSVPVFRYALERWSPGEYTVTVFHRGPLMQDQKTLLKAMQTSGASLANVTVGDVDVSQEIPEEAQQLWAPLVNAPLPQMVVQDPAYERTEKPLYTGPLDADLLGKLIDSPARRELTHRLFRGDSAIWILLETGDPAQDDPAAKTLQSTLDQLEKDLKLPEPDPDSADPPLIIDLPVKIKFSMLRVARTDPAEKMFALMLTSLNHPSASGPLVIPCFGRGRALTALAGKQLGPDVYGNVADFIVGACSCEVKDQNPGVDLLLLADWNSLIEGRTAQEPRLPPLFGLSAFAAATRPVATGPATRSAVRASEPGTSGTLERNMFLTVGGLGVLSILITLLFKRRRTPS